MTSSPTLSRASYTHAAACVARGIDLLDKGWLGWENEIEVDYLDLASCSHCMLGQLGGDYVASRHRLSEVLKGVRGITMSEYDGEDVINAAHYGFAVPDEQPNFFDNAYYSLLTELWTEEIVRRRKAEEHQALTIGE